VRRLPLTVVALAVMALSVFIWQWHDFAEFSSDAPSRFGWFGLLVPAWLVTAAFFVAELAILYVWSRRPRPRVLIVVPALAVLLPVTAYALYWSIYYLGPHFPIGGPFQ
jgi:MFS superfamily sulfate permease-like transporter